jgi:hypothetical protein
MRPSNTRADQHPHIQTNYEADTAVDVGKADPPSPAPRMVHQSKRRNRVVVDVAASSQDGFTFNRTSTGTVWVPGADEQE